MSLELQNSATTRGCCLIQRKYFFYICPVKFNLFLDLLVRRSYWGTRIFAAQIEFALPNYILAFDQINIS